MRRGLARSRARAHELVVQGLVLVDGRRATKPATLVGPQTPLTLDPAAHDGHLPHAWVGRGALKLVAALEAWPAVAGRVAGARALDAGASTGGFTQVLLRHEAAQVVALDVGHGQLVPELVADPRVLDLSGTSVRDVTPGSLGAAFDLVVADLSFISLTLVLPALAGQLAERGDAVLLVKPQFEVGRDRLGAGGVVTSPLLRRAALTGVVEAADQEGLHVHGIRSSPILGGAGNTEYLMWLRREPSATMAAATVADLVDTVTNEPDARRRPDLPREHHEGGP